MEHVEYLESEKNMNNRFRDILENNPIVAAVKDEKGLYDSLQTEVGVIFILYGNLVTLPEIVQKIHTAHRIAIVHVDLIEGLSSEDESLDYIRSITHADGIITTKMNLIQYGNKIGLYTVHRCFILDSISLKNIERFSHTRNQPDAIEILPGILQPKVIQRICMSSNVPIMCGGLISDKDDVIHALKSGAIAVSTTREDIWSM